MNQHLTEWFAYEALPPEFQEVSLSGDLVFTLPAGFCPPAHLAFTAEPHATLTTKHRVDISSSCNVTVATTAGATPYVSLDGIFFSTTN
jgi:hypothetical protein